MCLLNQYPHDRPDLWDSMRAMTGTAIQFLASETRRTAAIATRLCWLSLGPDAGFVLFFADLILTQRTILVGNETT